MTDWTVAEQQAAAGIDVLGTQHPQLQAGRDAVRIVCLVPSITEALFALGLGAFVVGRTGFCIHPAPIIRGTPKVGGTKDVNLEKIRRLAPTHVIVNIDENEKPVADALAAFVPHLVVTHPCHPQDNLALFRLLGALFGRQRQAENLCQGLRARLAALAPVHQTQQVLYCIWRDPWMTVGPDTYISRMLALIGWQCWQPPDAGQRRYPEFRLEQLQAQPPARILLSSEPYRFQAADVQALALQTGLPVQLVDGEMCSWYGSRALPGLAYLRQLAQG